VPEYPTSIQPYDPTTPPPDIANVFAQAYKIRGMKQQEQSQNALKQLFSDPNNLDPETKEPTKNALATYAKTDPMGAMAITDQMGKVAHDRALASEEVAAANLKYDDLAQAAVRSPALKVYEDTLKATGSKDTAQAAAQRVYSEGIDEIKKGGGLPKEMTEAMSPDFDYQRVYSRSAFNTAKHTDPNAIAGAWVTGKTAGGKPAEYNKITGEVRDTPQGFTPTAMFSADTRAEQGDKRLAIQEKLSQGNPLTQDDADFLAGEYLQTGVLPPMGMGAAAVKNRALVIDSARRQATSGGEAPAQAGADLGNVKQDRSAITAELTQLRRQEGSINQMVGTAAVKDASGAITKPASGAQGEADLVLKLAPKGLGGGGTLWNRYTQAAKVGIYSDEDVIALRNALLSLQRESAKVMEGSTGSVAAVSEGMSKEMEKAISGDMSLPALENAINNVMRPGWANRQNAVVEARKAAEGELHSAGIHAQQGGGGHALTSDLAAQYAKIPAANREKAKQRLQAAGYDVSGL